MARKTYLIVAALMRRGEEVLLVRQQGADDPAPSWALPGGVVEPGERLTEALIREVREETGLREPIVAYLRGEAGRGAMWLYRRQPDGADERVARIDGSGQ